jgi:hypothetical protein
MVENLDALLEAMMGVLKEHGPEAKVAVLIEWPSEDGEPPVRNVLRICCHVCFGVMLDAAQQSLPDERTEERPAGMEATKR